MCYMYAFMILIHTAKLFFRERVFPVHILSSVLGCFPYSLANTVYFQTLGSLQYDRGTVVSCCHFHLCFSCYEGIDFFLLFRCLKAICFTWAVIFLLGCLDSAYSGICLTGNCFYIYVCSQMNRC